MAELTYDDDRPGAMRLHIAVERALIALQRNTRDEILAHAERHQMGFVSGYLFTDTIARQMAVLGLIDAEGNLRDGFPGGA